VFGAGGDDGVSEGSEAVHPSGNPMSHSTHVGFNCPGLASVAFTCWSSESVCPGFTSTRPLCSAFDAIGVRQTASGRPSLLRRSFVRPFQSRAIGVGQRSCRAIVSNDGRTGPTRPAAPPWLVPYELALGVGNIVTKSVSVSPAWTPVGGILCRTAVEFLLDFPSPAVGVGIPGHDPDAIALMGCANIPGSEHCPFRIEPERGKVSEDKVESSSKEPWDVLSDDVAGSKYANESGELGPEPAFVGLRESLAGEADGLAGEPAGEDVDSGGVGSDRAHVVVAGDVGPVAGEDAAAPRVELALPGDAHAGAFEAQIDSADAGEEASDIHVSPRVWSRRGVVVRAGVRRLVICLTHSSSRPSQSSQSGASGFGRA
jgi:hypothetical protein